MSFHHLYLQQLKIHLFCDASFGNVKNGGSQGGHIIFITDGSHFSPLGWSSKRLKRVVKSTLAAETLAMLDAIDTAIFARQLFSEVLSKDCACKHIPICCFVDNKDLHMAVFSQKDVTEKRLRLELHNLQDLVKNDNVKVDWVPTDQQVADIFTKTGVSNSILFKYLQ